MFSIFLYLISPAFLCFFLSIPLGACCFFLAITTLFKKGQEALDNIIYEKTVHHHAQAKLAMEAAVVPPAKVETICEIATFNQDIVGAKVFQCRAVFYSNTISLYLIDALQVLEDKRKIVLEEHPLGKINSNCVKTKSMRLSRYHRHLDISSRIAPLKGKVLVLMAHMGVPLFLVNPAALRGKVLPPVTYTPLRRLHSFPIPAEEEPDHKEPRSGASTSTPVSRGPLGSGSFRPSDLRLPLRGATTTSSSSSFRSRESGCAWWRTPVAVTATSTHEVSMSGVGCPPREGNTAPKEEEAGTDTSPPPLSHHSPPPAPLPLARGLSLPSSIKRFFSTWSTSATTTTSASIPRRSPTPLLQRPHPPALSTSSSYPRVKRGGSDNDEDEEEEEEEEGDGKKGSRTHVLESSSETTKQMELLLQARKLILKFPTLRENERWLNLLVPTDQTRRWCKLLFHLPSSDVLHIFLARLYVENTKTSYLNDLAKKKVNRKIDEVRRNFPKMAEGTAIYLEELSFGTEFPVLSNVSEPTANFNGEVIFEADVRYRGGLLMVFRFDVRWYGFRAGQVSYSFEIRELSGHVRVLIGPPPSRRLFIGFLAMPELDLHLMRTKMSESGTGFIELVTRVLPNPSVIATSIAKEALFEDMILPLMNDFPFPVLGEDEEGSGEDGGNDDGEEEENEI